MRDDDRCTTTHNPGGWPYTAVCIKKKHSGRHHVDGHGREWVEEHPTAAEVWATMDDAARSSIGLVYKDLAEALDAAAMIESMR